jgi:hypothetical protein
VFVCFSPIYRPDIRGNKLQRWFHFIQSATARSQLTSHIAGGRNKRDLKLETLPHFHSVALNCVVRDYAHRYQIRRAFSVYDGHINGTNRYDKILFDIFLISTNQCTQLSQIHNNVFKNTTLVHVSALTGPSPGSTLIVVLSKNYLTIFWSLPYVEELMETLPFSEYV